MRFALILIPLGLALAQTRPAPLQNDYVRVLMGIDQPVNKPGPPHEHKQNRVMIYLDAGDMQIKYADGKVENQHWKQGDIAWSPANGPHTSQNVSSKPIRIVEVELRNEGHAGASSVKGAVLENAQVSVYRGSSAPEAGVHFVAVDEKAGTYQFDKMPDGAGPFVIVRLK